MLLKRPRDVLLKETATWDLMNLSQAQLNQLKAYPFMVLAFLAENCGFWNGDSSFHNTVTVADEAYIIFVYVILFCLIVLA